MSTFRLGFSGQPYQNKQNGRSELCITSSANFSRCYKHRAWLQSRFRKLFPFLPQRYLCACFHQRRNTLRRIKTLISILLWLFHSSKHSMRTGTITVDISVQSWLQWNLSIRTHLIEDISLMRTLSAVPTTLSCVQTQLWIKDTSLYRTASWVPVVTSIERSHCIRSFYHCMRWHGRQGLSCNWHKLVNFSWAMFFQYSIVFIFIHHSILLLLFGEL